MCACTCIHACNWPDINNIYCINHWMMQPLQLSISFFPSAIPPFIPSVSSPDDTSNFDVFEPQKEDRYVDFPSRDRGFSGKTLPFVGFTFTRYNSTPLDLTDGWVTCTLLYPVTSHVVLQNELMVCMWTASEVHVHLHVHRRMELISTCTCLEVKGKRG